MLNADPTGKGQINAEVKNVEDIPVENAQVVQMQDGQSFE